MKLEEDVQVRFLIKPIAYLHGFDEENSMVHSRVISGNTLEDIPKWGSLKYSDIRFRSLVFNSVTKAIQILDFGNVTRGYISEFELNECWSDIFKFDMLFCFHPDCPDHRYLNVFPKVHKKNEEANRYIVDTERFKEDVRSKFSFVSNPRWVGVFDPLSSKEDISIHCFDGSQYAKLKSEGETCVKCKAFYDMAEKSSEFTCWSCRNL